MDDKILSIIEEFFSAYKMQTLKKGELLIDASEKTNNIFYLEDGWVKMYSINRNGDELILTIFKPTSFFPMSLAFNKSTNSYYYESITEIKYREAPIDDVVKFIKSNPDVQYDLLKRVYRGLEGILLKMEYAMNNDAKSRLILELIIQARRFGKINKNKSEIHASINDISLSVGLARETVSRELKKLKDNKFIAFENKKITILDFKKLEEEIA